MQKLQMFQPKCKHRHTAETHPHCFQDGLPVEYVVAEPSNVLVFDVETLPLVGYIWNPWNTNMYENQMIKDFCILSYSAKWYGDDRILSDVLTSREAVTRNDKRILTNFWKLIDKADVVITHNGKRFDVRKLNARFWKNHIVKPSSYKVIDTLTSAKAVFGLTYNSMDFIAKYIGMQEKLETDFDLWKGCDNGNKEALQYMRDYNEQDIRVQEEVYTEMRGWIPNHPDMSVYASLTGVCPVCLDTNYEKIGLYTASKLQYPEYRCETCGGIWHDTKAVKE